MRRDETLKRLTRIETLDRDRDERLSELHNAVFSADNSTVYLSYYPPPYKSRVLELENALEAAIKRTLEREKQLEWRIRKLEHVEEGLRALDKRGK